MGRGERDHLHNPDVRNVAVADGPPKTVFVVVNNDIFTSTDDGRIWKPIGIKDGLPTRLPRGDICAAGRLRKTVFVTLATPRPAALAR